ncbi:hypothetical protein I6L27_01810 [Acinetobacter pittii]|uniref:hypothetical protein n=1 Tax=Acinetobacter pittii TaxID=48296 RepID=UPI001C22E739|nr:hypothetical protein [Acinetobacter pittii]QXA08302.1 hypothetical protein I6L27_01810 [Acinetobacter pittii]
MIEAWINYQYTNILGFLIFASVAWLALRSDLAKDFLAILLVLLLMVPVPFVMIKHFNNEKWIEFVFCGVLQIGLTYLCYKFIAYMIDYHKKNRYTIW